MTRPTNFLLFICDQLRADHIACYGNTVVKTPNIDRIAGKGYRLENMHVATPICMPNRASLMTGRYPSAHGARHNGIALSLQANTFVNTLRESGYHTAESGKIHLQNMTAMPAIWPREPRNKPIVEAFNREPGNYEQEKRERWLKSDDYDLEYPYYGFERVYLADDHADIVHGHYRYWLRKTVPQGETLIGPENAIPTPDCLLSRVGQAWRTRLSEDQYPSAYVADRTIDLLNDYVQGDKPFFIQCSFPDPHHPFTPPGKYWDMYKPEEMILPESFYAHEQDWPAHVQWLHQQRDTGSATKKGAAAFACNEREAREALALNYGSITNIDDQIGRVMQELDRLGLSENTVVIFTSDHGDFLGDHQLLLKGPLHYRGLTRVPFIWFDPLHPEYAGSASASLTSTIDIAPTVLARAQVDAYNGIQGQDMTPLLNGKVSSLRDALVIEEEGQRVILGLDTRTRCRTILSEGCRLSIYDTATWGELYDLNKDPLELSNLWDNPDASELRARMMEKLAYANLALVDESPFPTALA